MKRMYWVVLSVFCAGLWGCQRASLVSLPSKGRMAVASIGPLGSSAVKGTLTAREGRNKMVSIEINVEGLKPGKHGAHIHSGASCGDAGKEAGPHWDPMSSGRHGHPSEPPATHHAADMPNIEVGASGRGEMKFRTSNFKLDDLIGKTVIVHENFDNYTDSPANGGSGPRIGCGVITQAQ